MWCNLTMTSQITHEMTILPLMKLHMWNDHSTPFFFILFHHHHHQTPWISMNPAPTTLTPIPESRFHQNWNWRIADFGYMEVEGDDWIGLWNYVTNICSKWKLTLVWSAYEVAVKPNHHLEPLSQFVSPITTLSYLISWTTALPAVTIAAIRRHLYLRPPNTDLKHLPFMLFFWFWFGEKTMNGGKMDRVEWFSGKKLERETGGARKGKKGK